MHRPAMAPSFGSRPLHPGADAHTSPSAILQRFRQESDNRVGSVTGCICKAATAVLHELVDWVWHSNLTGSPPRPARFALGTKVRERFDRKSRRPLWVDTVEKGLKG
jgi:hypothetical protein